MNYIRHLTSVFESMDIDSRLTPYHVSLYMALFRIWNASYFRNPVSIARDEIMRMAKIGSVNTYTRSLKELSEWGYIRYEPSYNPHKGSLVYLYSYDKGSDKGSEIALSPLINNTNNINETNLGEQARNFKILDQMKNNKEKEKLREKKSPDLPEANLYVADLNVSSVPPSEQHVKIYFDEKGFPLIEAEKFYNYFQSNGWKVGGKTPMKDWKAAARNWILNMDKFSGKAKSNTNQLHAQTNKSYGEPL